MVFVADKKYACETCIKGHRSSICNHTDRPLFEIKKKGRPVTQCEHCRELRKTKQVHVKCMCEGKEESEAVSHSIPAKKANRKGPVPSPAFPDGLQSAGMASVTDTIPSKSKADQRKGTLCLCKAGSTCECCTPRHPPKAAKGTRRASPSEDGTASPTKRSTSPTKSSTSRSVVTRPTPVSAQQSQELTDALRARTRTSQTAASSMPDLSHGLTHGHTKRASHSSTMFDPYSHAHDRAHGHTPEMRMLNMIALAESRDVAQGYPMLSLPPFDQQLFEPQTGSDETAESPSQWSSNSSLAQDVYATLCQCGDGCACPGCVQHQGASAVSGSSTCANPSRCTACQYCLIDTFVNSSDQTLFDTSQFSSVDEWLRQMSDSIVSAAAATASSALPPDSQGFSASNTNLSLVPQFMNMGLDVGNSNSSEVTQYPPFTTPRLDISDYGSGCRCPPGQCTCSDGEFDYDRKDGLGSFPSLDFGISEASSSYSPNISSRGPALSSPYASSSTGHLPSLHSPLPTLPSSSGFLAAPVPNVALSRSSSTGSHASWHSSGSGSSSSSGSERSYGSYPKSSGMLGSGSPPERTFYPPNRGLSFS